MTVIDDAVEEHPRRRVEDGDSVRVRWSVVFQVVGYILGLFTLYNVLTNRMTAQEIRTDAMKEATNGALGNMKSDIAELKADVKILLARKP